MCCYNSLIHASPKQGINIHASFFFFLATYMQVLSKEFTIVYDLHPLNLKIIVKRY